MTTPDTISPDTIKPNPIRPGKILLFGSGETSPRLQNSYAILFKQLKSPVTISILETPAGFEPNSDYVAGQVAQYLEKRLQNFHPQISVIPARKRGTIFSPDNPELLQPMIGSDILFVGPGSPTYAVRQLKDSHAWHTLQACHRLGASVILASAAVLAVSKQTMPVYEIYKVGDDLHWKPGLDFFGDYGLSLIFVPHWNNGDGGTVLDTSRCYMGQNRFAQLLEMLPSPESTVVGIDENSALLIDLVDANCQVVGQGSVTILCGGEKYCFASGESFPIRLMGDFHLPEPRAGLPESVVNLVQKAKVEGEQSPIGKQTIPTEVSTLLEQRAQARADRNWALSDQLRDSIAGLGWQVKDTADGQQVEAL